MLLQRVHQCHLLGSRTNAPHDRATPPTAEPRFRPHSGEEVTNSSLKIFIMFFRLKYKKERPPPYTRPIWFASIHFDSIRSEDTHINRRLPTVYMVWLDILPRTLPELDLEIWNDFIIASLYQTLNQSIVYPPLLAQLKEPEMKIGQAQTQGN